MKKRKLPEYMFTKKQVAIFICSMLLYVGFVPFLVLTILTNQSIYSIIAICYVVLALIVILIINTLTNPLHKMEKERNITGDVKKFILDVESLKSDLVKEETINYLNILLVNAYFNVDLKKGLEMFPSLKRPTVKKFAYYYQLVEVCYHINKDEFDKANELITVYKDINPYIKRLNKDFIKIYSTKDYVMENIEKMFPINTKKVFLNVNNAEILLTYYSLRENEEKAKEYASFILNSNTTMEECNIHARKVLGE